MTEIKQTPEFEKDLKKLGKKYSSLDQDIVVFLKAIRVIRLNEIRGTVRIANLGNRYEKYPVYKVKSFRCTALKGQGSKSGIRVIYYDDVVTDEITLIQIYHKSTQENHDTDRILRFLDMLMDTQ